ncbi:sensor histidine kinase [Micromonospora sp. KC606]|uniref:sensor histidine kinase n=1 Tax=Micromonospora sp. KC606 TaxID=2530379 RepID=UPI00104A4FA1|nr:sensor histidine kinase [Micromonospora sp. KC606]TDC77333.1 sensor histidine kinase [Micromonospora sp. KC606]
MSTDPRRAGRLELLGWLLPLIGTSAAAAVLLSTTLASLALVSVWLGIPLFIGSVWLTRQAANPFRWICTRVLGVVIRRPYRPWAPGHLGRKWLGLVRDPATWRDLCWTAVHCTLGLTLATVLLVVALAGLGCVLLPVAWRVLEEISGPGFAAEIVGFEVIGSQAAVFLGVPAGLAILLLWWWLAPALLRGYAVLSRALLDPTSRAALSARVRELTESRAETVDAAAAELRRIERDLHDGTQARLVALGMSLGMADELLRSDPDAAAGLLAEARRDSGLALSELRNLVRGIHPPVLADRGLPGGVQALALAHPLPVEVTVDLPGRPPVPVESALYFAVAETLTNVAKHARAGSVQVRLSHADGLVRVTVADDGRGGANATSGGGLDGTRRRLAAFDGTLTVSSPPGGPTVITMEVPCVLSSPKITPYSGTG